MRGRTKTHYTGYKQRIRAASPYVRTLYAFNALSLVGGLVYGLYYGIFLYKNTFSLSVLAIDGLLGGLGCWLGYIIGVTTIRRLGYGYCLKAAFGLWAAVAFSTALLTNHISEWFMLLAVLKAIPAGMYGATGDTIMLREINGRVRDSFLQIKMAFEFFVGVMLPSVVGALISYTKGYELAFVLAGIVYLLAFLVPVRLPKPEVSLNIREVAQTFKRPLYPQHAANRTLAAGFNQLNGFMIMIIPFLMLQDEMKVGLLTSAIALIAGVVSLMVRKIRPSKKLKMGYMAYTIRGLGSLLFVSFWSAPILMIWQLINKLVTPMHDPMQQNLDIHNDKLIMGQEVQKKALHINVLNNTLLLIGTTVAYGAFFFVTQVTVDQQRLVLQSLIIAFALWRFVNLAISVRINSVAQDQATGYCHVRWCVRSAAF